MSTSPTKIVIKAPNMLAVKSSSIESIGYSDGQLFVKFLNGSAYRYPGVTPDEYTAVRRAESVGRHLQLNILRKYDSYLVPQEAPAEEAE